MRFRTHKNDTSWHLILRQAVEHSEPREIIKNVLTQPALQLSIVHKRDGLQRPAIVRDTPAIASVRSQKVRLWLYQGLISSMLGSTTAAM